jgi:hypothetical protein
LNTGKDEDAPWGHCDRDLPREAIVSPYGFKTAQAHYETLLAETTKRGGPNKYSFKDFPATEWNCVYENPARAPQNQMNWYWGANTQIATVVSLLTPKYQQRTVQEAYHQMRGHAIWPSTFCWPEGFVRRWYPFSVWEHYVIATPNLVEVRAGDPTRVHGCQAVAARAGLPKQPLAGVQLLGCLVVPQGADSAFSRVVVRDHDRRHRDPEAHVDQRQDDSEACSPRLTVDFDHTLVMLYEGLRQSEPEAASSLSSGDEWIENLLANVLRDTRPVVDDLQF